MPRAYTLLAIPAFLLLLGACGKGAPSRSSVSDLLTSDLDKRDFSLRFDIAYLTSDRAGTNALQDRDNLVRKQMLEALQAANLVASPTFHAEVDRGLQPAYIWAQLPTPASKPGLLLLERLSSRAPVANAVVARAHLITVTGVTVPTETPGVGLTCTADFSYQWERTKLGETLAPFLRDVPASDKRQGKAVLIRYDDGWRIKDLEL